MIQPLQSQAAVVYEDSDASVPLETLVRQFAVQQFVHALMGGDPELTGIPDITAQDG